MELNRNMNHGVLEQLIHIFVDFHDGSIIKSNSIRVGAVVWVWAWAEVGDLRLDARSCPRGPVSTITQGPKKVPFQR